MFCDPNILRHDSDSSSKGATSGMGLGRVKTPTLNLRVEIPSRFRKFENQKCLRPLLREDDRENNSAHSWMAGAMEHQATLLFGGLGWYKAHVGPGDCLANGLRVSRIVLLPLDVGLHIGRWDQPHGVTQCLELARPVVRRGAGFDTDQTGRQLLEERQDVAALQLAANDHLAASGDAVNLEN